MNTIESQDSFRLRGAPLASKGQAISIRQLAKQFGSTTAVDSVDLEIRAGEFLSLLGPSGSGKTTLLMMLAGFETPTRGAIVLAGNDLTHVPPNRRGIGMVFQRYALFPHMSVAQNVGFPLKMRGVAKPEIAARVERALSLVRLQTLAARMPNQLSGGQQQRVAVARALVFEPPVLLMDEPLGALDKKLREELQIEIKALHRDVGVTIIYVTHDQEEALTMSDRIAVMNHGSIEQLGSPTDLYHEPASSFVADFIGKTNFIDGTVRSTTDTAIGVDVGGEILSVPRRRVRSGAGLASGDLIRLAIRPESVTLDATMEQAGPIAGAASLRGVIDTSIFVGAHSTSIVRIGCGSLIHVQSSSKDRAGLLSPGTPVLLRPDLEALHVFPRQGGH